MTESLLQRISGSSARPLISVLTPTVPERFWLLAEARKSVAEQTYPRGDYEHLILEDADREGCAKTMNKLAAAALGQWLFLLADDDLMLPGCLMAHVQASRPADIVYSPPLVWGEDPAQFHGEPPHIPSAVLIRSALWRRLGGYDEGFDHTEDRDLYERAIAVGARFVRVDNQPCWVYRFHGGNKSRQLAAV